MKIELDINKSAQQNANDYYNRHKKLMQKNAGIEKAITDLEKKLEKIKSKQAAQLKEIAEKKAIKQRNKDWFEKFHWFFTSSGMLAIGGRDSTQNESINSKYFTDKDLFFHSDIFGASVVILKEGINANAETKQEVAQFAASYSSAWKEMLKTIDVYCVRREQVSKSTSKGSISKGSFLISGTREYFRNTELGLVLFVESERVNAVPISTFSRIMEKKQIVKYAFLRQGKVIKSDAAKIIAKLFDYPNVDDIMQAMPAGTFQVSESI